MNTNLPMKSKVIKIFFLVSIALVTVSGFFILALNRTKQKTDSYNPNNSYIITSEEINSRVANEAEARKLLLDFELGDEYLLKQIFNLDGGVVYHFQESFNGIPVHGRYSNVITSKDTTVEGISSNYYPINVDTSPKIDSDKALQICLQYIDKLDVAKDSVFIELCIYSYDESALLAYFVNIGSDCFYIDAISGDVIRTYNNIKTSNCLLTGNLGQVEVVAQEHNNNYELIDFSRGGGIESCILPDDAKGVFDFEEKNYSRIIISGNDDNEFASCVDAYYNVERAYDYFADVHNFYSTDGNNNRRIYIINNIDAYTNHNKKSKIVDFSDNAASTTIYNEDGVAETWFIVSRVNSLSEHLFSYYLDVMTHEYTHAVFYSIVGKTLSKQMDAVDEAYADIIGECCEAFYDVESDWDLPGCRNISSIANNKDLGTNINHIDEYSEDIEAHDASTVISCAAYYMFTGVNEDGNNDSQYAIHSYDALSKLWFVSMFYLTPSADFLTCRYAVESAADLMLKEGVINELQLQGISNAFDKVGIKCNKNKKNVDLMYVSPKFQLQVKDKSDRDYFNCEILITRIYKENDYSGHNIGIQYRKDLNECIYSGSLEDYPQKKLRYEVGSIYSIDLKDQNSRLVDSYIFEVKEKGPKELILHTSFLGNDFNPFEKEQLDDLSDHDVNDNKGGFVLENPYIDGYQTNETAFDNLFSGHFANMSAPMGLQCGGTYDSAKRFAIKASYDMNDPINGPTYLMVVDVLGNVYDMFPVSKYPKVATGWLKGDIFYCSDGSSAYIMKQGGDITDNFFQEDISLIDIVNDSNGILFFTAKTSFDSPYEGENNKTDICYEIWNEAGKIVLSFYKNELVNKYGIDSWGSIGSYHLENLSNGIYQVSDRKSNSDGGSPQYIFFDVNRKKAFAIPVNDDSKYEDIECDGNYILIPHDRTKTVTIYNIETEEYVCVENILKAHSLGEDHFFADTNCYDLRGNISFTLKNFDDMPVRAGAYHNGYALIITDKGTYYQSKEHRYGIGLLDENGSNISIIASLDAASLSYTYIQEFDIYCIFSREGMRGFLNKEGFQQEYMYGSYLDDDYYGVIDGNNHLILRYGYGSRNYSDKNHTEEMYGYDLFMLNQ